MSKLINAISDFKQLKADATSLAQQKLAKKMGSEFEKLLKEEIEKRLVSESMIEQQPNSIVSEPETSLTMKSDEAPAMDMGESEESEEIMECDGADEMKEGVAKDEESSETEEEDLDLKELEEAMKNLNIKEEESENLEEGELDFEINFDDESLEISNITINGKEMEDVEIESGTEGGEEVGLGGEEDIDLSGEEDIDLSGDDGEVELDLSDDEGDIDLSGESEGGEEIEIEDDEISEDEFENLDSEEISLEDLDFEDEVEEGLAHTSTHHNARQVGSEYNTNYEKSKRLRLSVREAEAKEKKLVGEVNKLKKENQELVKMNESFKTLNSKYKDQLYEMIFHNANLSHVNNLFVEHTTTTDEKKDILDKFNNVKTLDESKKLFKTLTTTLLEGKSNKKTLDEVVSKGSISEEASITESVSYEKNDAFSHIRDMFKRMERK